MGCVTSDRMNPFTGQYENAQHNAMDKVLWRAVSVHLKAHNIEHKGMSPDQVLKTFLRTIPHAELSACLTSAMEAVGLQLSTKTK